MPRYAAGRKSLTALGVGYAKCRLPKRRGKGRAEAEFPDAVGRVLGSGTASDAQEQCKLKLSGGSRTMRLAELAAAVRAGKQATRARPDQVEPFDVIRNHPDSQSGK